MKTNLLTFSIILGITSFAVASPPAAQAKRCLRVSASVAQSSMWDYCEVLSEEEGAESPGRPFYCCTR